MLSLRVINKASYTESNPDFYKLVTIFMLTELNTIDNCINIFHFTLIFVF